MSHNTTSKMCDNDKIPELYEEPSELVPLPTGNKPAHLWNTAFFFPCSFPDDPEGSLAKLLYYLKSAERSLKLCVMVISYEPIINAIIELHETGVEVRIFTSQTSADYLKFGKREKSFGAGGIPIRSLIEGAYNTVMHNKYAIVDDEAVLTGSLNWNIQSIIQQEENIAVTTNEQIVPLYVAQFDQIWNSNDGDEEDACDWYPEESYGFSSGSNSESD